MVCAGSGRYWTAARSGSRTLVDATPKSACTAPHLLSSTSSYRRVRLPPRSRCCRGPQPSFDRSIPARVFVRRSSWLGLSSMAPDKASATVNDSVRVATQRAKNEASLQLRSKWSRRTENLIVRWVRLGCGLADHRERLLIRWLAVQVCNGPQQKNGSSMMTRGASSISGHGSVP